MPTFRDRKQAGCVLAKRLRGYYGRGDVVVLGLPRGGVPVAAEVARELNVKLDVMVVRKLGVPGHEELALGAIASEGVLVVDWKAVENYQVSKRELASIIEREERELERRERAYRGKRERTELAERVVILVDDGLATGASMRAAINGVRAQRPSRVVVAVPIAAPASCRELSLEVDEIVCALTPEPFFAVGHWYRDFSQTTDEEVRRLLEHAESEPRRLGAQF